MPRYSRVTGEKQLDGGVMILFSFSSRIIV